MCNQSHGQRKWFLRHINFRLRMLILQRKIWRRSIYAIFLIDKKNEKLIEKNGYSLSQASDTMTLAMQNVIAYLNVILSPKKSSTILMQVANLIINYFWRNIMVNWGLTFNKLINKLVEEQNLYASWGSTLAPYAMHVYWCEDFLTKAKMELSSDRFAL